MGILYFATNRDRQNLGKHLDRTRRIQLQRGGYHWLDMKKYMSHYLATTDSSTMPPEVIIPNSEEWVFQKFLSSPNVKRIIIGVHGFNVALHGALTSFSILADTLQHTPAFGSNLITDPTTAEAAILLNTSGTELTAFVGYSWPSDGKMTRYQADRVEAVSSASSLANLIGCIRLKNPAAQVHVIAHSMGNYLTCTMLQKLVDKEITPLDANDDIRNRVERIDRGGDQKFFIDRYIMLAPDVERRHVTQCDVDNDFNTRAEYLGPFYAGLKHLVGEVHLFYSRFDTALKASKLEKEGRELITGIGEFFTGDNPDTRWESSLGLNPAPNVAPPNMYSYNGVTLTNREIDHGDYFDALPIADKIAAVLTA